MKKLLLAGTTIAGGIILKAILEVAWEKLHDEPAPKNPAAPSTTWGKAILWTLSTASLAGLTRLAIRKSLTEKLDLHPDEMSAADGSS